METAKHHWEILRRVPDELANKVREFMVIGWDAGVLLVTEDGDGYWLGKIWLGRESKQAMEPTRLNVPKLASMAHGDSHILLLDRSGQIHAMGNNYWGQLGLGTADEEIHFTPRLISSPHKFILVRCGTSHSLALTEDGKVWAWGSNSCGQVGVPLSTTDPHPSLHQISQLNHHRVVSIECGSTHSLALTDQGEVYAWGWNDYGQLGYKNSDMDGSDRFLDSPIRMPTPSPIKSIAAGDSHTLLLTQTGEVYACGDNEYGQLGIPTIIKSSASLVKVGYLQIDISQIASHFYTNISIAMSAEQECSVWGRLSNTSISTPLQLPTIYSTIDSVLSFEWTTHNTPYSVRVKGTSTEN